MSCTNSQIHDLLIELKQGNEEAAEEFYACVASDLLRRARMRGLSFEDAQDTVQQAMLRLFRGGINTYKGGGWAWLRTVHGHVVTDKIIEILRRQGNEQPIDELLESNFASNMMSPEQSVINEELHDALVHCLENISEEDRREILKKKKPGPRSKKWHEAVKRFRSAFEDHYKPMQ